MKKQMIGALALSCTLFAAAAAKAQSGTETGTPSSTQSGTQSGTQSSTQSGTQSGTQSSTQDADKTFLTTAAQSDFTEIKFSQLALDKGNNPRVKQYAQKMITDHNQLEANMKPFMDKFGLTPPTALDSDHQSKFDALSAMSGTDFDKQYMTNMDVDHHASLDSFKQELSTTQDPAFKKTVAKGEKVVAQHTMMADKAVKMMGGSAPAAGM